MAFDVPRLARNRKPVEIAPITPTKGQAAELAVILRRVMVPWRMAIDKLLIAYTPQTLDAPADNEAVIREVEGQVDILLLTVSAQVREWAVRIERWHRQKWTSSVYSATNVDLRQILTGQVVQETLEAFILRNVALAKDISAEAQGRIADAIYRGYQQRLAASHIAKEIRSAVDMGEARSIRIAGDQLSKLSAALDKERQLEAGIKLGKYRHSGKRHPREWHKARNGKIYDLRTRKETTPEGKRKPGGDTIPADDWPGFPPFCGCRMGAYLPIQANITPSVEPDGA